MAWGEFEINPQTWKFEQIAGTAVYPNSFAAHEINEKHFICILINWIPNANNAPTRRLRSLISKRIIGMEEKETVSDVGSIAF